jgi:hypothetical protein
LVGNIPTTFPIDHRSFELPHGDASTTLVALMRRAPQCKWRYVYRAWAAGYKNVEKGEALPEVAHFQRRQNLI